jgi:hypothetical protein
MTRLTVKFINKTQYQRSRYPHLITIRELSSCMQNVDLLAASITYSVMTPYWERVDYEWPTIRRCLCNGDRIKGVLISATFNKPTRVSDLIVCYINNLAQLNKEHPSIKTRVLHNLQQIQ